MDLTSSLDRLLEPRSVAIVGASPTSRIGRLLLTNLMRLGYDGDIYPVNPRYSEILGIPCFSTLSEIGSPVDAVVVALGRDRVEAVVEEAAGLDVGAMVILANGFSETASAEDRLAEERITTIANDSSTILIGPNCLGTISFSSKTALYMERIPDTIEVGKVAAICQSGTTAAAMLHSEGIALSHLITVGNRANLTPVDLALSMLERDDVSVLAVHLETIGSRDSLAVLGREAVSHQKPIIVLKGGRSEAGGRAVEAHTGGPADSGQDFKDLCDEFGFVVADDTVDLTGLTRLLATTHVPLPERDSIGITTLSGGQVALFVDYAEDAGVELARFAEVTGSQLQSIAGEEMSFLNPFDTARRGFFQDVWDQSLELMAADEYTGLVGIGGPGDAGAEFAWDLAIPGVSIADRRKVPVVYFRSGENRHLDSFLSRRGMLVVDGSKRGFSMLRKYLDHRTRVGQKARPE